MRSPVRYRHLVRGVMVLVCCSGCVASVGRDALFGANAQALEPPHAAHDIAQNPEHFLRQTLQRCQDQQVYAVDFWRQERRSTLLGIRLADEEHMRVKYQARPLSICMELTPPSTFSSVAYVQGFNNDKLRCKWRRALLPGARPPVNDYDLNSAVKFGFSRSPVTDFGVARLMQLIVGTMEEMSAARMSPQVCYRGLTRLEKGDSEVHHVELRYAPETRLKCLKVDLLVYPDSGLPAGCYLWFEDGNLDAKYLYANFDLRPEFTPADFQIE